MVSEIPFPCSPFCRRAAAGAARGVRDLVLPQDPVLAGAAQAHSRTPASAGCEHIIPTQVLLCLWVMAKGCILFSFP